MFIQNHFLNSHQIPKASPFGRSLTFFLISSPSAIGTLCLSLSHFHSYCAISFSPLYYLSLIHTLALILHQIGGGTFPFCLLSQKSIFVCTLTPLKQKRFIKRQGKKRRKGAMSSSLLELKHTREGTNRHTHTAAREESHEQKDHLLHVEKGGLWLWPHWASAVLAFSQHSQPTRRIPPSANAMLSTNCVRLTHPLAEPVSVP